MSLAQCDHSAIREHSEDVNRWDEAYCLKRDELRDQHDCFGEIAIGALSGSLLPRGLKEFRQIYDAVIAGLSEWERDHPSPSRVDSVFNTPKKLLDEIRMTREILARNYMFAEGLRFDRDKPWEYPED